MQGYQLNQYSWKAFLARRVGAWLSDIGLATVTAAMCLFGLNLAAQVPFKSAYLLALSLTWFVLLRSLGMSMGATTFELQLPDKAADRLLGALGSIVPGFNVYDAIHTLHDEEHRTFLEKRLGTRVTDLTMR